MSPDTLAKIRDLVAAIDALLNGVTLDSGIARAHIEEAHVHLTDVLDFVETAARYEQAFRDMQDSDREGLHPWMAAP